MSRVTEQRQIILEAFKKGYHPTAEELLKKLRVSNPDFSRATLYRNLALFCENGKLQKISAIGQTDRYAINTGCHYHVVCERCGKVEDIDMFNPLQNPPKLLEYTINYHELTFYGLCPKCQQKAKK